VLGGQGTSGTSGTLGACDDASVRMFVALTPPQVVIGELARIVEQLRARHRELRWSGPDQAHLTLAFLGEISGEVLPDLAAGLGAVALRTPPLELSLGGGGRFGHRVLWTRVRGETEPLGALAEAVRETAGRAGVPVEDHPYRPHLTLARSRGGRTDLAAAVAALACFDGTAWTARELHLVRSHLGAGPGGTAAHEPFGTWVLSGEIR
jgi:2'-5' RNA ligase